MFKTIKYILFFVVLVFSFQIANSQVDSLKQKELFIQKGRASYYARKFEGRRTANGERYKRKLLTAAHRTLPFNTKLKVTNPQNGRWVIVRINDRGPFNRKRIIDLSERAARHLGIFGKGHARVIIHALPDSSQVWINQSQNILLNLNFKTTL